MSQAVAPVPLAELEARSADLRSCAGLAGTGGRHAGVAGAAALARAARSARPIRTLLRRPARRLRLDFSRQRLDDDDTADAASTWPSNATSRDWIAHLFAGDRRERHREPARAAHGAAQPRRSADTG